MNIYTEISFSRILFPVFMEDFSTDSRRLKSTKSRSNSTVVPPWLMVMYSTIFFEACTEHRERKSDRFCIQCEEALCLSCLPHHAGHKCVKIRRYLYNDVINQKELSQIFNCSGIQTYYTNKSKVIFLKQRPQQNQQQQQQNGARDYSCTICDRSLQDPSPYCSITCKAYAINGDGNKSGVICCQKNDKETEEHGHKTDQVVCSINGDGNRSDVISCQESDRETEENEHKTDQAVCKPRGAKRRKGIPRQAPLF